MWNSIHAWHTRMSNICKTFVHPEIRFPPAMRLHSRHVRHNSQQTEPREEKLSVVLCQTRFLTELFSPVSWKPKDWRWHFVFCWWCIAPCSRPPPRKRTTKEVGVDRGSHREWKRGLSFSAVFSLVRLCSGGAAEADQRHCAGAELAERAAGSADRWVHSRKGSILTIFYSSDES